MYGIGNEPREVLSNIAREASALAWHRRAACFPVVWTRTRFLERNVAHNVYMTRDGQFEGIAMTYTPVTTRLPIKAQMVLTARDYSQIAATYAHAASDWSVPPQPRAAFAKKASWFRMRAQIAAAKQAMALPQNVFPLMETQPYRPLIGKPTPSPSPTRQGALNVLNHAA